MKQIFYLLFLLLPLSVLAQPAASLDFGLGMGVGAYYGDINQERPFYKPNLEIEGFVRYNFDARYALRGSILNTKLEGYDEDFDNYYQKKRNAAFSKSVLEVSLLGEVNFFPYLNPKDWDTSTNTLYAVVGGGVAMEYKTKDRKKGGRVPLIIMGVGYKRVLGSRWALEVEWAFRKCLNDELDGVIDPTHSDKTSRLFNNDWYNVLAVKLSYNLWSLGGKCRTFEKDTDL